jgi:crotonobetaine/carnitine-CoA ligase
MTETVSQNILSFPGFDTPPGCIGQPAVEYEVAIRAEDGSDAPAGTVGQLWIRGTPGLSLFLEYLNNPEATEAAFDADGWFNTGDQVVWEAEGFIRFVNRANDMLRVGEENVAASEVEMVVNRVPGVLESAVVGRPDDMLGEVPIAFIVVRDGFSSAETERAVHTTCGATLSKFKRPREVVVVECLPKGLLDKTLKRELRESLKQRR